MTKELLQLFKERPSDALFQKVASAFGGNRFDTQFTFNIYDMEKLNTLSAMKELAPALEDVYLDCKKKVYLLVDGWTIKNCINILRHFCKLKQAKLLYQEKLKNGVKYIQYTMYPNIAPDNQPVRITFD